VHAHRGTPLVVSYHPAFLLRSPHMTRAAWQDFQLLRQVMDEQA
jgi:DNA polymerase